MEQLVPADELPAARLVFAWLCELRTAGSRDLGAGWGAEHSLGLLKMKGLFIRDGHSALRGVA